MLLPETTAVSATVRVEALRKVIATGAFAVANSAEPIHATMSFGIATVFG